MCFLKVKWCLALTAAAVLLFTASCGANKAEDMASFYENCEGYNAEVVFSSAQAQSSMAFRMDMKFTKPDNVSYTVNEPAEFKGMELKKDEASYFVTYFESSTSMSEDGEAPYSVLFDVPDIVALAAGGAYEKDGEIVYEAEYGEGKCRTYFEKESFVPLRIEFLDGANELNCLVVFGSFEYTYSKS